MALRRRARPQDRRRRRLERRPPAAGRPGRGASRPRPTRSVRVRVSNDPGSAREKFELVWVDDKGADAGKPIDVYVPPGESRVVRVPRPPATLPPTASLRLKGDAQAFDNTLYFADERRRGGDRPLRRHRRGRRSRPACSITSSASSRTRPARSVRVRRRDACRRAGVGSRSVPLPLVVAGGRDHARERRPAPAVRATAAGPCSTWSPRPGRPRRSPRWPASPPWDIEEAADRARRDARRDRLRPSALRPAGRRPVQRLHQDPLLEISAHRRRRARRRARRWPGSRTATPPSSRKPSGKGRLVVLASGWQPGRQPARAVVEVRAADGGLARSAGTRGRLDAANHRVGDRVPLPAVDDDRQGHGRPQAGRRDRDDRSPEPRSSTRRTSPASTRSTRRTGARSFAVNLDPLGEQDRRRCPSRPWSSSAAGWRTIRGRRSTASSFGRCRTRSWKAARSSGAG